MLTVLIVLLIIGATIVTIAVREDIKNRKIVESTELKNKCGCGKTKNIDGNCDGSHMDA